MVDHLGDESNYDPILGSDAKYMYILILYLLTRS